MPRIISLEKVVDSGLCTGCGACQAMFPAKVTVLLNAEGYLRPQASQPLDPAELRQFSQICPGAGLEHHALEAPYDALWGPLMTIRTGYSLDETIRYEGSSGGVLSALLVYLLESKKVDFVAHVKADPADPIGNAMSISRNRQEVLEGAGSRYAPSAPLAAIEALLSEGKRFAFVGKPCDVAGLRQYLRVHPQAAAQIPYMLSFMCAGIPSRKGTIAILKKLEVEPEEVASFTFRGNGWPGMSTAITHQGRRSEMDYATSWGTILNRHLQFRCKICPDGIGEFADVVGADAWYGKDGYPDFAERAGRSLVLSRTRAGEQLVQDAVAAGYIAVEALAREEIAKMQPYQENRKKMILSRVLALRLTGRVIPRYRRFRLPQLAISGGLRENMRNFVGMARRTWF
ncbi:MAG: Coenzyme F420 hydrogenase/dehydrogenase, beta subunit C-terminal domain [Pseudomonadota bacterium]